ncbi:armadillo repeat-containing protein 5 [Aplochiton taeniatus]
MAALPLQGNKTTVIGPNTSREMSSSLPESSLTWCLSQLNKSSLAVEDERNSTVETNAGQSRDMDKKIRTWQWRALVAIRTEHIKGDNSGIARFRTHSGLKPLLNLLKHPGCHRKTLDLALSILANCCTEKETRVEVRKLSGISVVVAILKRSVAMETVQNRAARALGNLAMDPENSALIHTAGGVPLLLLCVSLASAPSSTSAASTKASCPKMECAQSAARALLYLSDTPANRLLLLTQGTLTSLAPLIAPEYPQGLRRAALRTLHELTKGCGIECSREVSRSGVLAQLGVLASGEAGKSFEELALKSLANMCAQGCLRPLVGSLEVIRKFTEEVKKEPLKAGVFFKALCLCCKEAVNRAKVKQSGGLEVLISFLSAHRSHPFSRLAILACVDFVYDESALEQLQELGLVPLLVARLVELAKGEEPAAERMDVSVAAILSASDLSPSCFDSFDFPALESNRKEEGGKEQGLCSSSSFLSLRSWLVSEGLISSEGELQDTPGGVEGDWASLQVPSSSSPHTSSPTSRSSSKAHSPTHFPPPPTPTADSTGRSPPTSSVTASVPPPMAASPQPPSACVPRVQAGAPPSLPSPTTTPRTPVSPTKFCSPPKKRPRLHSTARSAPVTLEPPPTVPRAPAYHHPYHPEPWAPESPILLLLSRFSHATDPSAALVTSGVVSGLLFYLTRHQDPSGRCFRMLCRLSCNPNCLQALVRSGSVALIRHHLCQGDAEERERQSGRVKAKVKQLGLSLLSNVRVQSESGFGAGVLAHVMLSGSESDRLNCALSLPLINSNKALLKKLLLDNGGLLFALEPLGYDEEEVEDQGDRGRFPSDWLNPQQHVPPPKLFSLYFSLLISCLSSLMGGAKSDLPPKRPPALSPVTSPSNEDTGRDSPPPAKKPQRRWAGGGGSDVASEYFRALLRGGFGEAQGGPAQAIPIKDVSRGMLLPVLHYLHGCRLAHSTGDTVEPDGVTEPGVGGQCQVLGSLAREGLGIIQRGAERRLVGFQKTALAELMMGACRFLVTALQRELEELCVALLLSCSTKPTGQASPTPLEDTGTKTPLIMEDTGTKTPLIMEDTGTKTPLIMEDTGTKTSLIMEDTGTKTSLIMEDTGTKTSLIMEDTGTKTSLIMDQDGFEEDSMDESLAERTSDLGLSGCETNSHVTSSLRAITRVRSAPSSGCVTIVGKSVQPKESRLAPVPGRNGPPHIQPKAAAQDSSLKAVPCGWALSALLPQVYAFSQRYSYPGLGTACLSLLLGSQGSPQAFSSSRNAADCLRRLARDAHCTDTLKQDILSLAAVALS